MNKHSKCSGDSPHDLRPMLQRMSQGFPYLDLSVGKSIPFTERNQHSKCCGDSHLTYAITYESRLS